MLVEGVKSKLTRHIHPQEAGALCGLDPCLTWGDNNRLALGAVGQLASPLQSLWIFSHILRKLQLTQFQVASTSPSKMMMAYRSWLLARCVKQWGKARVAFPLSETLDLSRQWAKVIDMKFPDLLMTFPAQQGDNHAQSLWERLDTLLPAATVDEPPQIPAISVDGPGTSECPTEEVASFVEDADHGLTISQVAIDSQSLYGISPASPGQREESLSNIEEVSPSAILPSLSPDNSVSASLLEDVQLVIHGDCGEVSFGSSEVPRATFRFEPGSTVEDLITAESTLQSFDRTGWEVFDISQFSADESDHELQQHQISTQEALRPGMRCKIQKVSGESESDLSYSASQKRHKIVHPVDENSRNCSGAEFASPLLDLKGKQFLKLLQPAVCDPFQACSLLSQMCPTALRTKVLGQQGDVCSDDELHWHLNRLQSLAPSSLSVIPMEPLLMHGWLETLNTELIGKWLQGNVVPDVTFIIVALQAGHWFPICFQCQAGKMSVSTWDIPSAVHHGLEEFCQILATAIDVELGPIVQHSRLFAGDGLCGAASVAFLGTQLRELRNTLENLHQYYRHAFIQAIEGQVKVATPWLWGAGGDPTVDQAVSALTPLLVDQAVSALTPLLVDHGVPADFVHHRAVNAVKAIGATDALKATSSKTPWKTLKALGTNVRFQFILPDELQAQITRRAGKEAVGRPHQKGKARGRDQSEGVVLDPEKLSIPDGTFVAGSKPVAQIPLTLLGPLSEGIVIATWQQAEPYLRTSQLLGQGPLAMLVLHGPVGGCQTTLPMQKITIPARCSVNNEPLLLDALLVQLGGVTVSKAVSQSPVPIDTVKVSTLKFVIFKDKCAPSWEEVTAPLRYIINHIPLLKLCKQQNCSCQHWHNPEKVEATESIVDVWRRQFLRAGYKPEPVASSTIFSVCIHVPECLTDRLLGCSGVAGIYVEPRSLDS